MPDVIIYSADYCPYCRKAKELLQSKEVSFTEIRVDLDPQLKEEMMQKSGRRTVPQIFIDSYHVGGCDDLHALEAQGELDSLLKG